MFSSKHLKIAFGISVKKGGWLSSEDGNAPVEYAVMLSLLVAVMLGTVTAVGKASSDTFDKISNSLKPAPDRASGLKSY
jgi:Flp pilus assembly pilin Flp